MIDKRNSPLQFLGILGSELGCEPNTGEVVSLEYLGVKYQARVISWRKDYDDFGNELVRYDLEAMDHQ